MRKREKYRVKQRLKKVCPTRIFFRSLYNLFPSTIIRILTIQMVTFFPDVLKSCIAVLAWLFRTICQPPVQFASPSDYKPSCFRHPTTYTWAAPTFLGIQILSHHTSNMVEDCKVFRNQGCAASKLAFGDLTQWSCRMCIQSCIKPQKCLY